MEQVISNANSLNTTKTKSRMIEQDIAKGICIFMVVFCHTVAGTKEVDWVLRAIFGYCMPFFFVICGYNFKPGKRSYVENIKKRARQMLLPLLITSFLIFVGLAIAMTISKGTSGGLDICKAYAGLWLTDPFAGMLGFHTIGTYVGVERVFEPYWFLLYLFTATLIYYLVVNIAYKNLKNLIVIIIGLALISVAFNSFNVLLPWGLHNAPAIAALMLIGTALNKYKILENGLARSYKNPYFYISMVLVIGFGLLFPRAGQISGSGKLTLVLGNVEVLYTLIYAFFATYFVIMLSGFVNKIPVVRRFLAWFGKNSLTVLLFHLLYMAASKAMLGLSLNAGLDFVTVMSWWDILALAITVTLMSIHILIQNKIVDTIKQRYKNKKLMLSKSNPDSI